MLGRIDEAIRRAELLPNPKQKTDALRVIGAALVMQGNSAGRTLLQRARATADAIIDNTYGNRAEAFHYLLQALAQAQRWAEVRAIIDTIPDDEDQSRAFELSNLAGALAQAQRWQEARATADAIPEDIWWRARALSDLAQALAQARLTAQLTALLTDFC
ncbi:MAG: hypothetical protein HGA19_17820, partial [Oscillochloris sp.]|nr:hypothetical protein [Oscillochloris sp.]